jgi:gluconokinase
MSKNYFQGLRSPKQKLAGWVHVGRFVDKIRLNAKGQLPADYQENFGKGFDGMWLAASGVDKDQFIAVVRAAKDDAEVERWLIQNVNSRKTLQEIEAFNHKVLNHGRQPELQERLRKRKEQSGLAHRDDIQTFVDYIDADEGRS